MTFTVIARDQSEGLLGLAQCSNPLAVGARCPFIQAEVGAVSSQAYTDPGLGPRALALLGAGHSPEEVLQAVGETDPHFSYRQLGVLDRRGRGAVHTGANAPQHKGAIIGTDYLVMGNLLAGDRVIEQMSRTWLDFRGTLFEDRLSAAVTAGRDAGGDRYGHRSACLVVFGTEPYPRTDLRIDFVPKRERGADAIDALSLLLEKWRPLIAYYKMRPHNPSLEAWEEWLRQQGTPFQD